MRLSGSQLQWDQAPEGQPGGENLPRGDDEASLAARLTGHQADQRPDGRPAQGQEEVGRRGSHYVISGKYLFYRQKTSRSFLSLQN